MVEPVAAHYPREITMALTDKEQLLAEFNGNPPADSSSVERFEAASGIRLSSGYRQFMQQMNGGEGFVGGAYLMLWRIEELSEMNEAYQAAEYAPGLLLFGSDGGGEAFAFDLRSEDMPVVSVPFVGMELALATSIAPDFEAFLEELSQS